MAVGAGDKPNTAAGVAPTPARVRELVTPEGVDLRLRLGEGGERAAAFLLDATLIVAVLATLTVGACSAAVASSGAFREMAEVIWLIGFFVVRNLYFVGFELRPGAATPGKRALGLRVAARNGGRLTADMVFARNFMRELEVYLPLTFLFMGGQAVDGVLKLLGFLWCGVFVLFPLFNKDRLRVGDLVAGTWVVKAPRHKLLVDLSVEGGERVAHYDFTTRQLDAYGVHELHVLEDVLRRRDKRTLQAVAQRIRAKIGWTPNGLEYDDDFLSAYYAALRGRLESRLLMGHRKRDKYDA